MLKFSNNHFKRNTVADRSNDKELLRRAAISHGFDPDIQDCQARVRAPGICDKYGLYLYQALAVEFMMETTSKYNSCILGDEMGLGKTVMVITFLTRRLITRVLTSHIRTWPHLHLNESSSTSSRCPHIKSRVLGSGGSEGVIYQQIPCLYEPSTSDKPRCSSKGGIILLVVPPTVIGHWIAEIGKYLEPSVLNLPSSNWEEVKRIKIHIAHEETAKNPRMNISKNESRFKRFDFNKMADKIGCQIEFDTNLEVDQYITMPAQRRIWIITTQRSIVNLIFKKADSRCSKAKQIIATAAQEVEKTHRLLDKVTTTIGKKERAANYEAAQNRLATLIADEELAGKRHYQLAIGTIIVDEFHQSAGINTATMKTLREIKFPSQPTLVGVSGTPISKGPSDLAGIIWGIQSEYFDGDTKA